MAERPCTAGHISIHAPRTGSDARAAEYPAAPSSFQSTLPARGATACGKRRNARMDYFNPRSPHGERPPSSADICPACAFQSTLPARGATCGSTVTVEAVLISIHAPRTGSDCHRPAYEICGAISIHAPRTGSDVYRDFPTVYRGISIHAPRTGSDCSPRKTCALRHNFNPRSPHGERRVTR